MRQLDKIDVDVPTLGVMSHQLWYRVEPVIRVFERQLPGPGEVRRGDLHQVVLDVRPLALREPHRDGDGGRLAALAYDEVAFLFALQQVEGAGALDSGEEPHRVGADQALEEADVARGARLVPAAAAGRAARLVTLKSDS